MSVSRQARTVPADANPDSIPTSKALQSIVRRGLHHAYQARRRADHRKPILHFDDTNIRNPDGWARAASPVVATSDRWTLITFKFCGGVLQQTSL